MSNLTIADHKSRLACMERHLKECRSINAKHKGSDKPIEQFRIKALARCIRVYKGRLASY